MVVQYGRLLTCKPAVHVNKKAGVCEWKLKLFIGGHFREKDTFTFGFKCIPADRVLNWKRQL